MSRHPKSNTIQNDPRPLKKCTVFVLFHPRIRWHSHRVSTRVTTLEHIQRVPARMIESAYAELLSACYQSE
jgi:hypothetical protein